MTTSNSSSISTVVSNCTITMRDDRKRNEEILDCLNGKKRSSHYSDSDIQTHVDLWHLRTLALQPGGLLSHRKNAWPKLMETHATLLNPTSNRPFQPIAKRDLITLQDHVQRWVSQQTEQPCTNPSDAQLLPVSLIPNELTSGTLAPISRSSCDEEDTKSTKSTVSILASFEHEHILVEIILNVLRQAPEENAFVTDDRFRYYDGLVDIAALLLSVIQSPTLTSIMLCHMAKVHLRDAMRVNTDMMQETMHHILLPLLHKVDVDLYERVNVMDLALSWTASWSCNDNTPEHITLRLWDVILASHPVMPIYLFVALLSQHRTTLLMDASMMKLPLAVVDVEELIDVALEYMRLFPPPTSTQSYLSMLQPHQVADWAPTDMSLLQQLRNKTTVPVPKSTKQCFPLAMIANGQYPNPPPNTWRRVIALAFVIAVLTIALLHFATKLSSETMVLQTPPPVMPTTIQLERNVNAESTTKVRVVDPVVPAKVVPVSNRHTPASTAMQVRKQGTMTAIVATDRKKRPTFGTLTSWEKRTMTKHLQRREEKQRMAQQALSVVPTKVEVLKILPQTSVLKTRGFVATLQAMLPRNEIKLSEEKSATTPRKELFLKLKQTLPKKVKLILQKLKSSPQEASKLSDRLRKYHSQVKVALPAWLEQIKSILAPKVMEGKESELTFQRWWTHLDECMISIQ